VFFLASRTQLRRIIFVFLVQVRKKEDGHAERNLGRFRIIRFLAVNLPLTESAANSESFVFSDQLFGSFSFAQHDMFNRQPSPSSSQEQKFEIRKGARMDGSLRHASLDT